MRAFRNAPIRRKLTLIMTLTSSVALLLATAGFVAYELVTFRSATIRSLQTLADIVGESSAAALTFRDPNAAAQTLAVLAADEHVESAALYTADGRVLARYLRPNVTVDHEFPAPEGGGHRFGDDHLILFRPVVFGGEPVGTVYVRSDLRVMHARLARYAGIVAGVFLVSLLGAFLISSRLQVVISGPIGHLAETAALVSREKNYALRAVQHSGDELGLLIETFNEMLARIHERDQELRRAQEHLEKRVAERTEELQTEVLARQQGEQTIRQLAYFDALTGLPNRLLFGDRLSQALAHAERAKQSLAVMFLDLDRFKTINDTLGHAMGDQVLRGVADRLRHTMRAQDTVARLGGDEFLLFAQELHGGDDAVRVATKMLEALKPSFELDGYELHVTASVGISLYPGDGQDAETLIKNADSALYRAKDQGRNTHQLFTAAMHDRALERLVLENSIRRALERDELTVYYQPQVSPRTGEIVAVEALLRATAADLEGVPPAKLVHLAEESGLIVSLGQWVLRTACAQARAWLDAGLAPGRVAVNLSAHHFKQKDFVRMVERTAAEAGLPPRYLTLEVTESVIMENVEATIGMLHDVKALGVTLSIDDFGTGYSSLSYLKRLPIDSLKIDRSFVRDIPHDADDAAIATLIIAIAHTLGLEVVAEGVETEGQLAFLHGCDAMQGFLISRPLPAKDMTAVLEAMREGGRLLRSQVVPDAAATG